MATTTKTQAAALPSAEGELRERARRLALWGVVEHFDELAGEPWLERLVGLEEEARRRRGLERRVKQARLGRFKPMCDFEWNWPTKIDRELLEGILRRTLSLDIRLLNVVADSALDSGQLARDPSVRIGLGGPADAELLDPSAERIHTQHEKQRQRQRQK